MTDTILSWCNNGRIDDIPDLIKNLELETDVNVDPFKWKECFTIALSKYHIAAFERMYEYWHASCLNELTNQHLLLWAMENATFDGCEIISKERYMLIESQKTRLRMLQIMSDDNGGDNIINKIQNLLELYLSQSTLSHIICEDDEMPNDDDLQEVAWKILCYDSYFNHVKTTLLYFLDKHINQIEPLLMSKVFADLEHVMYKTMFMFTRGCAYYNGNTIKKRVVVIDNIRHEIYYNADKIFSFITLYYDHVDFNEILSKTLQQLNSDNDDSVIGDDENDNDNENDEDENGNYEDDSAIDSDEDDDDYTRLDLTSKMRLHYQKANRQIFDARLKLLIMKELIQIAIFRLTSVMTDLNIDTSAIDVDAPNDFNPSTDDEKTFALTSNFKVLKNRYKAIEEKINNDEN